MHRSCAARYFLRLSNSTSNTTTNKKSTYPCPACKQEWNKDDVNSILKANKINEENDDQQSTGMVNKKQRTTDHNNSTNNRSIRSSTRRKVVESDDDDDDE